MASESTAPKLATRNPKRRFLAGLLTGSIAAGALFAGHAVSAHGPDGERGPGRHCAGHHGAGDPEAMRSRMRGMTDRMLAKIDATDEQKTRIRTLMDATFEDLAGLRDAHDAQRKAALASLTGETVDRAALESARRAEMALADRASERLSRTAADVAEVLTPDQRRRLAEMIRHRGGPLGFGPLGFGPGAPHGGPRW